MANDELRFTVSPTLYRYLAWLKDNSVLGKTENEVAKQILTDRLAQMRQEDYREKPSAPSPTT